MKIAQIAPSQANSLLDVPDVTRVATCLARQLVVQGNEVMLLTARSEDTQKLRVDEPKRNALGTAEIISQGGFDIVHVHGELLDATCLRDIDVPVVATFYRYPQVADILSRKLTQVPVVAVSYHQRASLDDAHWEVTIPCGLSHPRERFTIDPEDYLAYVGPVSANGGVLYAVEVAARSNVPLHIAGSISTSERRYFSRVVAPLIESSGARVEFVGGRDSESVLTLLSRARALLFLTDWPDPCPTVLLDALACGTPVIARFNASMPEIIEHEVTGFLIDNVDEAVRAVGQLHELKRLACRRSFDERFAIHVVARRHMVLYRHLQHSFEMARVVATSRRPSARELSRR